MSDRKPVFFRGALVGYVHVAERRFVRRCDLQRAIARKYNALPLHDEVLDELRALGVVSIEFFDVNSGDRYVAPLAAFFSDRAIRMDLGRGAQRALRLGDWEHLPADPRREPRGVQRGVGGP